VVVKKKGKKGQKDYPGTRRRPLRAVHVLCQDRERKRDISILPPGHKEGEKGRSIAFTSCTTRRKRGGKKRKRERGLPPECPGAVIFFYDGRPEKNSTGGNPRLLGPEKGKGKGGKKRSFRGWLHDGRTFCPVLDSPKMRGILTLTGEGCRPRRSKRKKGGRGKEMGKNG